MTEAGPVQDAFVTVARAVAGEIGYDFLRTLVVALREVMGAEAAIVSLGQGSPPTSVRALYAVDGGEDIPDMSYSLDGAPCALVFREAREVVVPCDLARRFPREAGLESFVGVPLHDKGGAVIGHLAVFGTAPLVRADLATAHVAVFAQRAEAELRRLAMEEERERLMADLAAATARLRSRDARSRLQNAHKTELLGIIAHDLRGPLAAILAQAELASSLAGAGRAEKLPRIGTACDRIAAKADEMAALIEATLRRVRAEDETLSLSRSRVALVPLIARALEASAGAAARKGIALRPPEGPGEEIEGDEDLLLRAVDNLVSNAVKYGLPGGVVQVSLRAAGDGVEIAVADDGQGLDAGDLRRAFGRFETLSAQPTGGETATGLGLANVMAIARAHGGTARAESAGRGRGATFTLALPRHGRGTGTGG